MGNLNLVCGPDLEVAVQNVAEAMTQPIIHLKTSWVSIDPLHKFCYKSIVLDVFRIECCVDPWTHVSPHSCL